MKQDKPTKEQIAQLKSDLNSLSEEDFRKKYHTDMSQLKGLSETELEQRATADFPEMFWFGDSTL